MDDHAQYWATLKRHLIREGVQVGEIQRMDVFDFFALLKAIHTEEKK
jgi:hypothetical protein